MGKARRNRANRAQSGPAPTARTSISLGEIAQIFGRSESIEIDFDDPAVAVRLGFDEFIGLSDLAPAPPTGQPRCACCGSEHDVRLH